MTVEPSAGDSNTLTWLGEVLSCFAGPGNPHSCARQAGWSRRRALRSQAASLRPSPDPPRVIVLREYRTDCETSPKDDHVLTDCSCLIAFYSHLRALGVALFTMKETRV